MYLVNYIEGKCVLRSLIWLLTFISFTVAMRLIDDFVGQTSPEAVQSTLDLMLNIATLDDLYGKIMTKIEGLPEMERDLAKKAIAWLLFVKRPLMGVELTHALAIEDGSLELNEEKVLDNKEIVLLCMGFVDHLLESGIWLLVHSSARDYLRKTLDTWGPDSKETVATGCLSYLPLKSLGKVAAKTMRISTQDYESFRFTNTLLNIRETISVKHHHCQEIKYAHS
jgi:hypothetical protein